MIKEIGTVESNGNILLKTWEVDVPNIPRVRRQHYHIQFEISLVLEGNGEYLVGEESHLMEKGDVFIFGSNEQHCIMSVGKGGMKMLNLQFEPRYLWGNSPDSLSPENINLCFAHNKAFCNRILAKDAAYLAELITKIAWELNNKEKEYALTVKSLLNFILIELIRNFGYTDKGAELSRDRLHTVRKAVKYIDEHIAEPLSLSALAKIAGMTPNYFSKVFHDVSGITLWDYINSKRIDRAVKLLHESDMNILEIATVCGFNNTANFNKAFKKVTGLTPSEHRGASDMII